MRMGILFVLLSLLASPAAAQSLEVDLEVLALRSEAREVTGLYVASGCLLGTAALMFGLGLPDFYSGDSIGAGVIPVLTSPLIGLIGLSLLSLAAGYDAGVSRWNAARARRSVTLSDAPERSDLSTTIASIYGVGLGLLGAAGVGFILVATIDGFHTPIYVLPTIGGGIGLLTLLAAAGMDIAAGAWSGFSVSASPTTDGAMASMSGTF